ncbi:hypothetical protein [Chryseobacterium sp.]|uniref:hypothetical protein n=1 Tax=Chryseobacterium sp. TaxID=1871047 RepID=UPI00289C4DD1|nr:hypothetical protein [Chryseobacterium sp.]
MMRKIKTNIFLLALTLMSSNLFLCQIGIGTTSPANSAYLDVFSPNKGILLPRMNLTGRNDASTVTNPANGLITFNQTAAGTTTNAVLANSLYFRQNTIWQKFASETELNNLVFSNQYVLESFTQQPFTTSQLTSVNGSETADIPVTWAAGDVYLDNTDDIESASEQNFRILTTGQYRILANFTFNPRRSVTTDNSNYTSVTFTVMKSQNNGSTWAPVIGATLPYDNGASNNVQTVIIPRTIVNLNQDDLLRIVMTKPGTGTPNFGTNSGIIFKAANDITKLIRIRKVN